jgi:putrescine aminotransferase
MTLLTLHEASALEVKQVRELYQKHINPGLWTAYRILGTGNMDVESAEGMEIHLRGGKTILDFSAAFGILGLGHNHPRVVAAEKLCHEQKIIDALKVGPHKLQAALAYNLAQFLPPPLEVCFFTVSGAEAVEAAMKLCERAQGPTKRTFITTTGAFHGKTHGALALTTDGSFQDGFLLGLPEDHVITVPYGDVEAVRTAIQANQAQGAHHSIIAMIVEPIQGQSVVAPPPGYLKAVVDLCHANGILVIFDEVKVGMGRTGVFCAFQSEGAVPDVVTLSKALGGGKRAIGAMVTSQELFAKAYGKLKESALHTTTFGGLGESCAVAIETLNVFRDEHILEGVQDKGRYLKEQLLKLQDRHPGEIAEIRGRGLFQGVQFHFNKGVIDKVIGTRAVNLRGTIESIMIGSVVRELFDRHDIIAHFIAAHPDVLQVMPPLIVETSHLDRFVAALDDVLAQGWLKLAAKFIKGNLEDLLV